MGFVCLPGAARAVDAGEFEVRVIADAEQTDGVCSVIETGGEPDVGPPLHIHRDEAEASTSSRVSTSWSSTTAR
jgi:hypothetical protein